jgi:hypothetical protein
MSFSIFPNLADDADVLESFSMQLSNPNSVASFSMLVQSQSSADFEDLRFVVGEGETPPPSFNGKYEGSVFNSTLSVSVSMPEAEEEQIQGTANLLSLELLAYNASVFGFNASTLNETSISLEGKALNVFTDAFYEFLMPDLKTVKRLEADTIEDYAALVKWNPPSIKEKVITHYFTVIVTYDETSLIGTQTYTAVLTLTLPQTIRWNYDPAVLEFSNLLEKGVI